jgi:hypothetical protein
MVLTAVHVNKGGDKCSLEIPRLLEDQSLRPTLATVRYLQDTRTVRSDGAIFLFLAAVPPHGGPRSSAQLAQKYDDSSGHSGPLHLLQNSSGDNIDSI